MGQYGEGFKAATVCLLRANPKSTVVARSGNDVVWVRIGERSLEGSDIQPMVYEYFHSTKAQAGSQLIVEGVSPALLNALETSLDQFYYPGNSLIGNSLSANYSGKYAVFESLDDHGHIFYRKLRRGVIKGIPLIFVMNEKDGRVE